MMRKTFSWILACGLLGLGVGAAQLVDDGSSPDGWVLDPSPAEQRHSFELQDGAVRYDVGGEGKHSYNQLLRRGLAVQLATSPRYGTLEFQLKGDGTGIGMQVIVFCTDGSRWQHAVTLEGTDWRTVRLPLRDFALEPHGNQAPGGTGAWPDSRTIDMVSFWLLGDLPHQLWIDDLSFDDPVEAAANVSTVQAEFYPATTHRGGKTFFVAGEMTPLELFVGRLPVTERLTLELTLPAKTRLAGAFIGSNTAGWPLDQEPEQLSERQWRLEIPASARRQETINKFQNAINLFCFAPLDAAGETGEVAWTLTGDTGELAAGQVAVEVLAALPERSNAERAVQIYTYATILFAAPQPEIREGLFQLFHKAGISGGVIYPDEPAYTRELVARGWMMMRHAFNWWGNWGAYAHEMSSDPQTIAATKLDGSVSTNPSVVCPTWLLANADPGEPYYEAARAHLAGFVIPGMAGFLNDHEMVWEEEISPANSCFDARCLAAFTAASGVDVSGLTPPEIVRDHRDAWYAFRFRQQGELIGVYDRLVKSFDPQFRSAICSFVVTAGPYETPIRLESYDALVDEHWPMCYKSGVSLHYEIENTVKGVEKPITVLLNNCDPINERVYNPPAQFRLNLLGALTSGVRGIGIFTGDISLDGEYLQLIRATYDLTAGLERWVPGGRRVDEQFRIAGVPDRVETRQIMGRELEIQIPDWSPVLRSRVFEQDGSFLALAYNYSGSGTALVRFEFPQAERSYQVYDPVRQRRLTAPGGGDDWSPEELKQGILSTAGAWDAAILILAPEGEADWSDLRISGEAVRREYTERGGVKAEAPTWSVGSEVTWYPLGTAYDEGTLVENGRVGLAADAEALYVEFDLDDAKVSPGPAGTDAAVWSGDCAEVFLTDGASDYFHFGVDPAGGKYDAKNRDAAWNGAWEVSVTERAGGWRARFTIPWRTLEVKGAVRGNFARENLPGGELSTLAPNGGDFHQINSFVELRMK